MSLALQGMEPGLRQVTFRRTFFGNFSSRNPLHEGNALSLFVNDGDFVYFP
jgi:hypothetical protein